MECLVLNSKIKHEDVPELFNEMCYEIFVRHKKGETYVRIMELMLMRPVAMFGKQIDWTFGNEGRNDFIRNMFNAADAFMNKDQKDTNKVKKVQYKRRNPALDGTNLEDKVKE